MLLSLAAFVAVIALLGQARTPVSLAAIVALAIVILALAVWSTLRPDLRLRTDRPEPSVSLKL